MTNLLVIDFDYFFPTNEDGSQPELGSPILYDWGHSEGLAFMQDTVWVSRAASFKRHGMPRPDLNGEQRSFWDRFNISRKSTLFYADSNRWAAHNRVTRDVNAVWLYDAHHDSGYRGSLDDIVKRQSVSCEDWMCYYHLIGTEELHVRYPTWRRKVFDAEPKPLIPKLDRAFDHDSTDVFFNRIFVCRSGSWVPSWVDSDFETFIANAPVSRRISLDDTVPRTWDDALVDREIEAWELLERRMT